MFDISKSIVVSERDNGDLDLVICISDFKPNANKKKLKLENAEENIKTLVNMPLVGRIAKIANTNEDDFTSHNKKVKYEKIGNELKTTTYLDTDAFGVFTDCYIEYIDNEPFIFAKAIVWGSRFKKAKEVILNRVDTEQGLFGSWELIPKESTSIIYDGHNVDEISVWEFIGFALLGRNPQTGSTVNPAYKCAKVLEVAEEDSNFENELSSAIVQDIEDINKGGNNMGKNNNVETSSLTLQDIRKKVYKLVFDLERDENFWLCDSIIQPLENTVYFSKEGQNYLEEDYLKVVYSIDDNGEVSIVSKEDVKMVFVAQESVVDVSELNSIKTELSEKIDSIVKLGETINNHEATISEKNKEIAELEVFKSQVEQIQIEQAEKELSEQRKKCKATALSSGFITEKDIEASEELQNAINNCDDKTVKLFIAEAVIKQNDKQTVVSDKNTREVEVSTDLNSTVNYEYSNESSNPILNFVRSSKKRYI